MPSPCSTYKPSTYYFRQSLRAARTKAELTELTLAIIAEHEALREWVREHGMVPPKWFITPSERAAKAAAPAGAVCPFSTTTAASATGA